MLDWVKAQLKLHILRPRFKRLYDRQSPGLSAKAPRALLSYIVHPFSISPNDPRFLRHINIWRTRKIVRVLNELGYIVDVVDYRDTKFVPHRKYEVFIGHGGINFERVVAQLPDRTTKIYFSTGTYWKFGNEQELARLAALQERRGVNLPPDRLIAHSEEGALLAADGIIGMGNDFVRQTYADFSPVIMINNTALADDHYEQVQKDFEAGRSHFLYYTGEGNVHKGLDLLLEAFLQLKGEHLWICTPISQRFKEVHSEALQNRSNIHVIGWVQARSSQHYEVMDRCNWTILPSCSEGQPHSVVECMNQGLIPVVSQACGLDIGDYGVMLNPCTIERIAEVVQSLSQRSPAWCEEMSRRSRKAAVTEFSETAFLQNMREAMQAVIKRKESAVLRVISQRWPQEITPVKTKTTRPGTVNSQGTTIAPFFVDENINITVGQEAEQRLQSKNDKRYLQEGRGVIEVDVPRWEEAQRYERRAWMEGRGRKAWQDRNREHERHFENYNAIEGRYFDNAIEIGCGPFTNMVHILKYVRCQSVTLLDPLIDDYLMHPHCRYKRKRLGWWFGKKVRTVALPVEHFATDQVYDLVVVINVLEHCFSTSKFFERILSLTSPNGVVVFHDKLILISVVGDFVRNVYDAGHPLRVADNLVLEFLCENFDELFRKNVLIPSPIGRFDSVYFIGRKWI